LRAAVGPLTRVVFVNNASFPSGWVINEEEWTAIASLCVQHDLWLLYWSGFEGVLFDGIVFAPLLHAGWGHLFANTVPLLVFGFLILLAGVGRWVAVTAVIWLVGGAGVWVTGADQTVHLGASVLAFGWLVYLLLRGFFSRSAVQVLIGVVLLFLYGGVLWGVLPGQPGVSWQGHLFGAVGGACVAWWLGRRDRSREAGLFRLAD